MCWSSPYIRFRPRQIFSGNTGFGNFLPAPTASPTKSALTPKPAETKTAGQKFLEWAKMTPTERMHAQMLSQLGITEEQFKAMDPAAQQKIEDKIRDMIKKHAADSNDKRTGLITDKTA